MVDCLSGVCEPVIVRKICGNEFPFTIQLWGVHFTVDRLDAYLSPTFCQVNTSRLMGCESYFVVSGNGFLTCQFSILAFSEQAL